MIYDRGVSFKFLHEKDGQPLRYEKVCIKEDKIVPWNEVAKGYEVSKNHFIVFKREELDAVKPESDNRIRVEKFVDYLSVDPVYFQKFYILAPDDSSDAYTLLLDALQRTGKAGAGRITLKTKEYPVLIQAYKGAIVLTTMRYSYEVADPADMKELKDLKEPSKEESDLAIKIVKDLSGEFNIDKYKDTYKIKVDELIKKKMKGETITAEKPPKEEVKELMVALQETLKQMKKK